MATLYSICPDADSLLELEPEELAGVVLEHLHSLEGTGRQSGQLNRSSYTSDIMDGTVWEFPKEKRSQLLKALTEAWVWLEREGLLAPIPGETGPWVFITRRVRERLTAVARRLTVSPAPSPVLSSRGWMLVRMRSGCN